MGSMVMAGRVNRLRMLNRDFILPVIRLILMFRRLTVRSSHHAAIIKRYCHSRKQKSFTTLPFDLLTGFLREAIGQSIK